MLKLKSAEDVCKEIELNIKEREQKKFAEDLAKHSFSVESEHLINLIDEAIDNCSTHILINKVDFIYWQELKKLLEEKGYYIIEYNTCLYIVFDKKNVEMISICSAASQAFKEMER